MHACTNEAFVKARVDEVFVAVVTGSCLPGCSCGLGRACKRDESMNDKLELRRTFSVHVLSRLARESIDGIAGAQ